MFCMIRNASHMRHTGHLCIKGLQSAYLAAVVLRMVIACCECKKITLFDAELTYLNSVDSSCLVGPVT